jgi:hypothetical protein
MVKSMRALFLAVVACIIGACEKNPAAGVDSGVDGALDADAAPVVPDADARVGDGAPPEAIPFGGCDQAFIKLPIDGSLVEFAGADVWGDRVVVSLYKGLGRNIHLFDLAGCNEYRLTDRAMAFGPTLHESSVFWIDETKPEDLPPTYRTTTYRYDLDDWMVEPLFALEFGTSQIQSNGAVAAFSQSGDESISSYSLNLYDLETGIVEQIVPPIGPAPAYKVDSFSINDHWLVFTAFSNAPGAEGRDVFVHDLNTSVTTHVESTLAERQNLVKVWGEYAVWSNSIYASAPPHTLVLYHLLTGNEQVIVEDDGSATMGLIHRNLVAYTTDRYQTGYHMYPADIEVYDIETGAYRRITTFPSDLRAIRLYYPWLLAIDYLEITSSHQDFYVINLERLGITDVTGHVLEGDPVLEPPPR